MAAASKFFTRTYWKNNGKKIVGQTFLHLTMAFLLFCMVYPLLMSVWCSFKTTVEYDKETYDNSGNPIWTCECFIKDLDEFYYQTSYSKKEAKKQAAYQTLLAVLESENGGDQ